MPAGRRMKTRHAQRMTAQPGIRLRERGLVMVEEGYWRHLRTRRLNRRRLLGAAMAAGTGLAGAALLACGSQSKPGQQASTKTNQNQNVAPSPSGSPQTGGNLKVFLNLPPP